MRTDFFGDANPDSGFTDDLPETISRHFRAPIADKKKNARLFFQKNKSSPIQIVS